jgi:putative tricarboxylic transport membrane protein
MELLDGLSIGFTVAFSPLNLVYALAGAVLGTMVGVLPGLGPVSTIALLLPATFGLPPVSALIMLSGVYYGAQYGGSTSAILLNLPGEASSVVTCLDGYQMTQSGRGGVALSTAALGSFVAGTVGTAAIVLFAPLLTRVALSFGPAEYVALLTCGLTAAVALTDASPLKAAAMVALGLVVGLVGADLTLGFERFTFGITALSDGINFVVVAIGIFGFAEIMDRLGGTTTSPIAPVDTHACWPSREERRAAGGAVARGTLLGIVLGVLPGAGAVLSSFAAYSVEKKLARNPVRFGHGAIEGVAGPEAANNAAAQTSFIPLLTLGIPSNAVMALMLGALTIHGVVPGPDLMTSRPQLFWGTIVSMWIGNVILLALNLPLIPFWVKLLNVPYRFLYPSILVVGSAGVYSVSHSTVDVLMAAAFGLMGYVFMQLEFDRMSFLLGFILGPMVEENLQRALTFAGGDATVFVQRPVSLLLLLVAATLLLLRVGTEFRLFRERTRSDRG